MLNNNKYFKKRELDCSCCGELKMSEGLIDKLTKAREIAGIPFIINSGYRCPKHNKAVGGVDNSSHVLGYAVDIKVTSTRNRFLILNALLEVGFNRIGIYNTFIHADVDPTKSSNVVWYGK